MYYVYVLKKVSMPMQSKTFVNEVGNSIEVKVRKKNGVGTNHTTQSKVPYRGVYIQMIGPTSESSNEVTRHEAMELYHALRLFFKNNP
jgi:hypothetical protein